MTATPKKTDLTDEDRADLELKQEAHDRELGRVSPDEFEDGSDLDDIDAGDEEPDDLINEAEHQTEEAE